MTFSCVELTPVFIKGREQLNYYFGSKLFLFTMCCSSVISVTGPPQAEEGSAVSDEDSEVEVVYVREPTAEQAALARKLKLPLTFFCYKNEPGYTSDDQTDGKTKREVCFLFK